MANTEKRDLKDPYRGQWPRILTALAGLTSEQVTDKHQPCPLCGGKDRYRFDDKDGDGTWYCNQCGGPRRSGGGGNGWEMLMRRNGMDLVAAIKAVDQFLGIKPARSKKKSRGQGEVVATYVYVPGKQEARRIQYENGDKVVKPFHHNGTRWVGCIGPKKPPKANPWIAFRQDKVLGEEIVYEFEGENVPASAPTTA